MSKTNAETVIEYITTHPGCTAIDICKAFKKIPTGSISGVLSKHFKLKTINRTGTAGAYRYYVGEAPSTDLLTPPDEPAKRRRRHRNGGVDANVLISIAIGKNNTETMTVEQARAVYKHLHQIFGDLT